MAKEKEVWVTTEDNPFDPFTQMDRWMNYDYQCGYNTCDKLARLAAVNDNLSPHEQEMRYKHAIEDLCDHFFVVRADGLGVSPYVLAVEGQTKPF